MAEPESIDINELASRIEALDKEPAGAGETPETDREHAAEQAEQARVGNDAQGGERSDAEPDGVHEGDDFPGDPDEPGEEGAGDEAPGEDAPEFWSAEDKAFWDKIPQEVRPLVKKYEEARVEFANQQRALASETKRKADEEVNKYKDTISQAAQWWQQAGPALNQAFADKWTTAPQQNGFESWADMSDKNPALWAKLNQQRADEGAVLAEANRRGQADIETANKRAKESFEQARLTEHGKIAKTLPDYFGTNEKATATYKGIGEYLHSKGIEPERIRNIYEAPIIEIALKAKLYDEAQKKASVATSSGAAKNPATPAPTRVAPGPAARTANRGSEAARQAKQRFMQNPNDMDIAAEYLRTHGLA